MATVLIVDDDRVSALLVQATLKVGGHEARWIEDPRTLAEEIRRRAVDAIVLDVMMPGISGWEVLEELRSDPLTKELPILMFSAAAKTENIVRGIRLGADDFLAKPFSPDELLARVESLVARRHGQLEGIRGSLAAQSLGEVLQALAAGAKTGSLWVSDRLGSEGLIGLIDGQVIAASFGTVRGGEAILDLLGLATGIFTFESGASDMRPDRGVPAIQSLLLESAWLDDETSRLAPHIPPDDLLLTVSGPLPPVPTELRSQPMAEVYAAIEARPGCNQGVLASSGPWAFRRLRLLVGWLVSEGVVVVTTAGQEPTERAPAPIAERSSKQSIDPQLDEALRELFQDALFRRLDLAGLNLWIFVHPHAWPGLETMIGNIPPGFLIEPAPASFATAAPFSVYLTHGAGDFRLHLATLRHDSQLETSAINGVHAVFLWTKALFPEVVLTRVVHRIEEQVTSRTRLVVIPDGELALGRAQAALRNSERWSVLPRVPKSFGELLLMLVVDDG